MMEQTNLQKTLPLILGLLLCVTPVLAATPVDNMVIGLRNSGFGLIMLWLLTLAVVFGALTKFNTPESMGVRGVIAIATSFLVLIAAAGTQVATILSNIATSMMAVAFSIIVALILLELAGAKTAGKHIFEMHPMFFGAIILIIVVLLFVSAGGLGIFLIPIITSPIVCTIIFLLIIAGIVWTVTKEN
jgi:hypothetical protein